MSTSEFHRSVIGLAGGSGVRVSAYQGRNHLIVPVVAIIGDRVIQASNAPSPELVPSTVIGATPGGWNGRPVVPFHPQIGDGSANTTEILEGYSFGQLFNTRFQSGALQTEAWLDLSRIDTVGELAQSVVARCQSGELVSVSIGAYVRVDEDAIGTHDNQPYKGIWLGLVPDHLAMLPEDVPGACSLEMGCGGPRAMSALTAAAQRRLEPIVYKLRSADDSVTSADSLSDEDVRMLLQTALSKLEIEYQYIWVSAVYDDRVVYSATKLDDGKSNLYSRTYTRDGDTVVLSSERIRMKQDPITYSVAARGGAKMGDKTKAIPSVVAVTAKPKLRDRLLSLVSSIRTLVDTPTEAASEEAAELVGYSSIKTLLDQVSTSLSAAQVAVDNLISDETESPTETAADEAAEEEVETARLQAIQVLCMSMYSNLSAVMSMAWALLDDKDDDDSSMTGDAGRYSMARIAAGKRNNDKDQKTIQAVHDHTMALGAICSSDNTPSDSKTKGANAAPCGCTTHNLNEKDVNMTKEQKDAVVSRLIAASGCPFDKDDKVMLTGLADAKLEALSKQYPVETEAPKVELAKVETPAVPANAALSITGQLAAMSAADREKILPADVVDILTRYRASEAATRAQLIAGLTAAQKEFTAVELALESTERLQKLSRTVKVPTAPADYSGMPFASAPADNVTQAAAVDTGGPWTSNIKALAEKLKATNEALPTN